MKQTKLVGRKIPQRTCVVCRRVGDKSGLIRLVKKADGGVIIDESGRLPGRGAYICGQVTCWQGAAPQIGRALKMSISTEMQEALLARGKEIAASRQ